MNTMNNTLDKQQIEKNELEEEENFLNLWSYLKRRYPNTDLDSKGFFDLIRLKADLEGPKTLRNYNSELAGVRKR